MVLVKSYMVAGGSSKHQLQLQEPSSPANTNSESCDETTEGEPSTPTNSTVTQSKTPHQSLNSSPTQSQPPSPSLPNHKNKMSTPLTQRQYAVAINTSLNKLTINKKLNEKNYIAWSHSIARAVRSIGLHPYLKEDIKPDDFVEAEHLANLECLTNWLLNQMGAVYANQIESDLAIPGSIDLEI